MVVLPASAGPPSVGAPVGARTSSLAWVPGLPLLVVTDDAGNLCVLDSRGDACGAALVCGVRPAWVHERHGKPRLPSHTVRIPYYQPDLCSWPSGAVHLTSVSLST